MSKVRVLEGSSERRSVRGFSLTEALVAVAILAVAGIPLYQLISVGVGGVERSRDQMIAYAVAEKIQEKLNALMRGTPEERKTAIEFKTSGDMPLVSLPFFPELKSRIETAIAATPAAKGSDSTLATRALANFTYKVDSTEEKPKDAPEATWLSKDIFVYWKDQKNRSRSVQLGASFSNPSIYYESVKASYANSKSITDRIMQNIMNRRNQPLVKIDAKNLLESLQYPVKSNEFLEPDPWYEGYLKQAPVSITRRLGTEGQTSDERMAVKEAGLSQFFNLTADQAKVITYDLKDEAEAVVKKIENLPPYSETFKNLTGVAGVGVRSPGQPGKYSCLNCHSPQFFATLDEGYLSLPPDFLSYKSSGVEKTGKEWMMEYLDALKMKKALSEAEYNTFVEHLNRPDVGIFSGATSPR